MARGLFKQKAMINIYHLYFMLRKLRKYVLGKYSYNYIKKLHSFQNCNTCTACTEDRFASTKLLMKFINLHDIY